MLVAVLDDDLDRVSMTSIGLLLCRLLSHQGLAFGIHTRAVQRVTRYYINIRWKVLLKGRNLRGFARSLAADDGSAFGGCRKEYCSTHIHTGETDDKEHSHLP